jgi:hypothetical protein
VGSRKGKVSAQLAAPHWLLAGRMFYRRLRIYRHVANLMAMVVDYSNAALRIVFRLID